ncbi:unnamed protein product [Ectocarpus sp. 4 AP-2014]
MVRNTLGGFDRAGREATGRSCLYTCSSSKASWRRACQNFSPRTCTLLLSGGGLVPWTAIRTTDLLGTLRRPAKSWLRWSGTRNSPATSDSRNAAPVGPPRGCCRGRHWHESEPMRSSVSVYREDRRSTVVTAHGSSKLARGERPSR